MFVAQCVVRYIRFFTTMHVFYPALLSAFYFHENLSLRHPFLSFNNFFWLNSLFPFLCPLLCASLTLNAFKIMQILWNNFQKLFVATTNTQYVTPYLWNLFENLRRTWLMMALKFGQNLTRKRKETASRKGRH